jgi:hypothetical protein
MLLRQPVADMPPRTTRIIEHINGRDYRIEVAPVGPARWRAHVMAAHGGPTALMPFYGVTAESAVSALVAWLTRARAQNGSASGAAKGVA